MIETVSARRHRPVTTTREDLITMATAFWLMAGLFLDAWAHTIRLDELEGFWTPWHGVFYSGFLATAAWIAWLVNRGVPDTGSVTAAIPVGYGPAVVGIALFAMGGVGDAIWHTIYGVEASIDALLSPTHLLLFSGLILILTAPFRAAWHGPSKRSVGSPWGFVPAFLSITLATALVAFMFTYLWAPGRGFWPEVLYDPLTGSGELHVVGGIGSIMATTGILVAPLILTLRRWTPPPGTFTVMWTAINLMMSLGFDLDVGLATVTGLVGGLVADGLVAWLDAGPHRVGAVRAVATAAPIAAWATYFLLIGASATILWPVEVWSGAIFFAGLAGFGLTVLAWPPVVPDGVLADSRQAAAPRS